MSLPVMLPEIVILLALLILRRQLLVAAAVVAAAEGGAVEVAEAVHRRSHQLLRHSLQKVLRLPLPSTPVAASPMKRKKNLHLRPMRNQFTLLPTNQRSLSLAVRIFRSRRFP